MNTFAQKNHTFRTRKGNEVEVFSVKEVSSNGSVNGFGRTVSWFAQVAGVTVVAFEGSETFRAAGAVQAAGF